MCWMKDIFEIKFRHIKLVVKSMIEVHSLSHLMTKKSPLFNYRMLLSHGLQLYLQKVIRVPSRFGIHVIVFSDIMYSPSL